MVNVQLSTDLSILIQLLTGLISFGGLYLKLPPQHTILIDILTLETTVQFIELFFYIYFLRRLSSQSIHTMATTRYFDWFITTPAMLLTTIIYFKYEEYLEKNQNNNPKVFTFWEFVKENKHNIVKIYIYNFLMLLFGYLGETGHINMTTSLTLGFIFFGMSFYTIYNEYAIYSQNGKNMFNFIFSIWLLYGVAALFNSTTKNHMFNILDIFAKNFFGLYLYFKAKKLSVETLR
jgi:bacteriorhodopsin